MFFKHIFDLMVSCGLPDPRTDPEFLLYLLKELTIVKNQNFPGIDEDVLDIPEATDETTKINEIPDNISLEDQIHLILKSNDTQKLVEKYNKYTNYLERSYNEHYKDEAANFFIILAQNGINIKKLKLFIESGNTNFSIDEVR